MVRVFIAEKPFVSRALVDYMKRRENKEVEELSRGVWRLRDEQGNTDIVYALAGHVLSLYDLKEYDEYKDFNWNQLDRIPCFPKEFKKKPSSKREGDKLIPRGNESLLKKLKDYLDDCDEAVNFGDPDDEGQYLVDEVLKYVGWKGKTTRLWVSSLSDSYFKKGLSYLEPNSKFESIGLAAEARAKADWLFGINGTVLCTTILRQQLEDKIKQKTGHKKPVISVGRVQTAVLRLIAQRENENKNFVPKTFYTVKGTAKTEDGNELKLKLNMKEPSLIEDLDAKGVLDPVDRFLISRNEADNLAKQFALNQQYAVSNVEYKESQEHADLPFSLLALQQYCSKNFGYSSSDTLAYAEKLYLSHYITYPRNKDCRHLSKDELENVPNVFEMVRKLTFRSITQDDIALTDEKYTGSKAWNDEMVKKSSHPAIIPTENMTPQAYNNLDTEQRNVYDAVMKYYLYQFMRPAVSRRMSGSIIHPENKALVLKFSDKTYLERNWLLAYKDNSQADINEKALPQIKSKDLVTITEMDLDEGKTNKPPLFNDGTLIVALAEIYKFIDADKDETGHLKVLKNRLAGRPLEVDDRHLGDDETQKIFNPESGIGTDATRSSIIKLVFDRGYIRYLPDNSKSIVASTAGHALLDYLPKNVCSFETTAEWQLGLDEIRNEADINKARVLYDNFLKSYTENLGELLVRMRDDMISETDYKPFTGKTSLGEVGDCEVCHKVVHRYQYKKDGQTHDYFQCPSCNTYHKKDCNGDLRAEWSKQTEFKCLDCQEPLSLVHNLNKKTLEVQEYFACKNKHYFSIDAEGKPTRNSKPVTEFPCLCGKGKLLHIKGQKKDGTPFNFFSCEIDKEHGCGAIYNCKEEHGKEQPVYPVVIGERCPACDGPLYRMSGKTKSGEIYEYAAHFGNTKCQHRFYFDKHHPERLAYQPSNYPCVCGKPYYCQEGVGEKGKWVMYTCFNDKCVVSKAKTPIFGDKNNNYAPTPFNMEIETEKSFKTVNSELCPKCKSDFILTYRNKETGKITHCCANRDCGAFFEKDATGKFILNNKPKTTAKS